MVVVAENAVVGCERVLHRAAFSRGLKFSTRYRNGDAVLA